MKQQKLLKANSEHAKPLAEEKFFASKSLPLNHLPSQIRFSSWPEARRFLQVMFPLKGSGDDSKSC